MIWFTSDTHFWHNNIIGYCNRPYSRVSEMNQSLIMNWNNSVFENDDVYFLGDFAFCSKEWANNIALRLNGRKHMIRGNHDRKTKLDAFLDMQESLILETDGFRIFLCHYPKERLELPDNIDFSLHGHTHGNMGRISGDLRMDVGVDCNDYAPVSLPMILNSLKLGAYSDGV